MKKIRLFVIIISIVAILTKITVDAQYKKEINAIFNDKITHIELIQYKEGHNYQKLNLNNENEIIKFVKDLNTDKWAPIYIDLNSYMFRYKMILNDNTYMYFTLGSNGYICMAHSKYYHVPKELYLYFESLPLTEAYLNL